MHPKELKAVISLAKSILPSAYTASGNGTGVDTAGYEGLTLVAIAGTITDGTHAISVEDSPDNSAWTAVAATYLSGSFSNLTTDSHQTVEYIGHQRYVRAVRTVSGASTGGVYTVEAIRHHPRYA